MATHSTVLAWKIPWTGEPGRLHVHGDCKELDMTERLSTKNIFLKLIIFWNEFVTFIIRKKKKAFELHRKVEDTISSVQSLSRIRLCAAHQASLSITNSQSPPKPISIESMMPSKHLILCRPLLLLSSIFPSIRVFSKESVLHIRWPKYWSVSFNISPSNQHSGLISFRVDWLDLLAVQGILQSLLQHHSSKASILQRSAFFIVQLSHSYMTTGKTIA